MIETFIALLLAHVVADFLLQPSWMVRRKANVFVLLLHAGVVWGLTTAALGGVWEVALVVAGAHLIIDALMVWAFPRTLWAFLLDQAAHIATLIAAALYWPVAASTGLWAPYLDQALWPAIVLIGAITAIFAGGYAIGEMMRRFPLGDDDSLPEAGQMIGRLERSLIFLLIMVGQPAGVGFLIAAKSILRFDTAAHQRAGEYVIIGTLASFAWALAASYATLAGLEFVTPSP